VKWGWKVRSKFGVSTKFEHSQTNRRHAIIQGFMQHRLNDTVVDIPGRIAMRKALRWLYLKVAMMGIYSRMAEGNRNDKHHSP
jgi:hypothetical protein